MSDLTVMLSSNLFVLFYTFATCIRSGMVTYGALNKSTKVFFFIVRYRVNRATKWL